jgi:hypothetical protein
LATPSQRLIETIEGKEWTGKRWSVDLIAKIQYDDNVVLVPTTSDVYFPDNRERQSVISGC